MQRRAVEPLDVARGPLVPAAAGPHRTARDCAPFKTAEAGRILPAWLVSARSPVACATVPTTSSPSTPGPSPTASSSRRPQRRRTASVNALIRASIDESARRVGVDRRRFLQGAGAVAASLAVFEFAGCASPPRGTRRRDSPRGRGGRFKVPPPEDTAACQQALTGSEFIFDVHTHHVIPTGPWVDDSPDTTSLVLSMLPAGCTDTDQLDCVDRASYLHDIFLASDTTMAVLTDVPNSGPSNAADPLPRGAAHPADHGGPHRRWRQPAPGREHHRPQRRSGQRHPGRDVERGGHRARRRPSRCTRPGARAATGLLVGGPHHRAPHRPARARPRGQGVRGPQGTAAGELRPGLQPPRRHRRRVAPVPRHAVRRVPRRLGSQPGGGSLRPERHHRHRHAAGRPRPPRRAARTTTCGSTWPPCGASSSPRPTRRPTPWASCSAGSGAQRVMWGTDAIWYGSPEAQIMAMRTFEITPEFQETYDYPALTADVKAGLFGLNAATALRGRPDGHALRPDPRSAHGQHLGGGRAAPTRARCPRPGSRTVRPHGARCSTGSARPPRSGCRSSLACPRRRRPVTG